MEQEPELPKCQRIIKRWADIIIIIIITTISPFQGKKVPCLKNIHSYNIIAETHINYELKK